MRFRSFLDFLNGGPRRIRVRQPRPRAHRALCVERLEDRSLLSAVSFTPHVDYQVGQFPNAAVVGDFNGDSQPDLVTAGLDGSVLLGNGDGSFQSARSLAVGSYANAAVAGDFDGDSQLDVVTANGPNGNVSVLLGNGDGSFQTAHYFAVGAGPISLGAGDFNGDGQPDLAVVNDNSNTVSVLLGNGDGTFQTAEEITVGPSTSSLAVGDFNGDGQPDLAVGKYSTAVSVLLGNGDGTFQPQKDTSTGDYITSVAVGNFNGDGQLDLAVVGGGSTVRVLRGNGDGTFQPAVSYAVGDYPIYVAVADFSGDNNLDLATANVLSGNVSVLLGNGDATFQPAQNFSVGRTPHSLAVGDFNRDGGPDLAVAYTQDYSVSVLLNQLTTTTTAVTGPSNPTYGQPVTYTARVTSGGAPLATGTVTFMVGSTPLSPPLSLDANGQATFRLATLEAGTPTITASYSGTPRGAGSTGFGPSKGTIDLNVAPALLSATAVNFAVKTGAPSGVVATFANADPFGSADSYYAVVDWGDGSTTYGTITGDGTLSVSGTHAYAEAGNYTLSVEINHNAGNTTTATVLPTARVTSLGQSVKHGLTGDIGFWHSKDGQTLINRFNGDPGGTALSGWLAETFPNLYGNLWGYGNADVAAYYQGLFAQKGPKVEVQLLATALNVYATTRSLGGTAGQKFGFRVTDAGLGAYSFNVGKYGEAIGVSNKSTRTVYGLLQAVDRDPWSVLSSDRLRKQVNDLFDEVNKAGKI